MDRQPVGERELLRLVGQLVDKLDRLERRVQELEEWLTDIGEDVARVVGSASYHG